MSINTTKLPAILSLRLLSALPFAIYYSSLQLYLLNANFSTSLANAIVGTVLALSFSTSLVGGWLTTKYIDHSTFFIFCILCQAIGCIAFITVNHSNILWLTSLFLLGSSGTTLCLNMMITQIHSSANNHTRDKAFFWMYIIVNIGYMIGYLLSGYLSNIQNYEALPIIPMLFALSAICITCLIKQKKHRDKKPPKNFFNFAILILLMFFILRLVLQFPKETNIAIIIIWALITIKMYFSLQEKFVEKRNDVKIFYLLLVVTLIFWSVYFLAPITLIVFIKNQVALKFMGLSIAPQWIQNINTAVVILGRIFLTKTKESSFNKNSIMTQFSVGLLLLGLAFAVLSLGIYLANSKVMLTWIIISYILQGGGEILIGPIGYSLIGRLIPEQYRSIMMGIWITILGAASAISSELSNIVIYSRGNPHSLLIQYNEFFITICALILITSIIIFSIKNHFTVDCS